MRDLHNAGLHGRLPLFIESFLKNRQFHVRLGSSYSDLFDQEMGVPQGSILSVSLFGLKINSIVKAISPGVECSLYVDDFLLCYRSKHIHIIERHFQQCLNKLADWADTNGFKFSPSAYAYTSANCANPSQNPPAAKRYPHSCRRGN